MMSKRMLHGPRVRLALASATLVLAYTALAAEREQEARPEVSPPAAGQGTHTERHEHGAAGKREFRAIHNMDEMHRMGGAPGMGLEGGRIQMPAAGDPAKPSDEKR